MCVNLNISTAMQNIFTSLPPDIYMGIRNEICAEEWRPAEATRMQIQGRLPSRSQSLERQYFQNQLSHRKRYQIIPYTKSMTPIEFIQSFIKRMTPIEFIRFFDKPLGEVSLLNQIITKDPWPIHTSCCEVSRVFHKLNGEEIAEALQSEAVFTIATDKKPIVATYGCGP